MIPSMFFLVGMLQAGIVEDLQSASNEQAPESDRMAIFEKLTNEATANQKSILTVAKDSKAASNTRWVAIRVLGKAKLSESTKELEALCSDPDSVIRVAAITALSDMNSVSSTEVIASKLKDPALIVRGSAADALAILKDIRTIDDLADALESKDNYYRGQSVWVRVRFVLALGEIGSKIAFPALEKALVDEDPKVVTAALVALRNIVGFDFSEGRSREEHIQAWIRWIPANQ